MEKIYVYDFDKTIYDGDSSIDFFKFCFINYIRVWKYIPLIVFNLILYMVNAISAKKFKERFFSFLIEFDNVDELVESFWLLNKNKIYKYFDDQINLDNRLPIYIISASPEFLLYGYTKNINNLYLIATKMDKKTGKIYGENCKGNEKLNRLPKNIKMIKFFSDSYSDRFLAAKADNSFICWKGNLIPWSDEKFKRKKIKKIALGTVVLCSIITFILYLYVITR